MKATPADISFARLCAGILRNTARPVPNGDLYAACLNEERALIAACYSEAAEHMEATGEWRMPTQQDLDAVKAKAWAVLG